MESLFNTEDIKLDNILKSELFTGPTTFFSSRLLLHHGLLAVKNGKAKRISA
jgi:hypothetical protein